MPAERVRGFLMSHGVSYTTHEHPIGYTAQEAAEMEGVAGAAFAKPVMLMADGDLIMAVLPAPELVDLEKAQEILRCEEIRIAGESDFASAFPDCERGAEPPFGALYGVGTLMDRRLTSDVITFRAGTHTECITMTREDYVQVNNPRVVDIAIGHLADLV